MGECKFLRVAGFAVAIAFVLVLGVRQRAGAAAVLFGAAHDPTTFESTLYTIDPATGVAAPVGSGIGFKEVGGIDFDPVSGTLFATGLNSLGNHVLLTINTSTGAGTVVGTGTTIESQGFLSDLDFGTDISFKSDGTLFGYFLADFINFFEDGLFTINLSSGVATLQGTTGLTDFGNGIASSAADMLLHAGTDLFVGGKLGTLNQTTGNSTFFKDLIFTSPLDSSSEINAMDFEPRTGILFASVINSSEQHFLSIVNTGTGAVTVIGQTVSGLDAIAFMPLPGAPPPATGELDHFQCNKVKSKGKPPFMEVTLDDGSGPRKVRVLKPASFCKSVDKNGEGISDPAARLTCYKIKDVKGKEEDDDGKGEDEEKGHHHSEHRKVIVENQFGPQTFVVKKPKTLCVPSAEIAP